MMLGDHLEASLLVHSSVDRATMSDGTIVKLCLMRAEVCFHFRKQKIK